MWDGGRGTLILGGGVGLTMAAVPFEGLGTRAVRFCVVSGDWVGCGRDAS